MSLDSTMDKVLQRRAEVEERLSQAAEMTPAEMANLSRELTELRPVCEQIELVNRLTTEIADAQMMVDEACDDNDDDNDECVCLCVHFDDDDDVA